MTGHSPKDGIDPKVYENVEPPKPEHNNPPQGLDIKAIADSPLAKLTMADFKNHEEKPFVISLPRHGDVAFKLDEVVELKANPGVPTLRNEEGAEFKRKERFSVFFLGPQDLDYEQGCFDVKQQESGFNVNMFLVPIQGSHSSGDNKPQIYLQALFN